MKRAAALWRTSVCGDVNLVVFTHRWHPLTDTRSQATVKLSNHPLKHILRHFHSNNRMHSWPFHEDQLQPHRPAALNVREASWDSDSFWILSWLSSQRLPKSEAENTAAVFFLKTCKSPRKAWNQTLCQPAADINSEIRGYAHPEMTYHSTTAAAMWLKLLSVPPLKGRL